MRLSMDKNDRAYNPYEAIRAKVYLDGVELNHCFTADEETGECVCLNPAVDVSCDDQVPTIVRSGKVEIVLA